MRWLDRMTNSIGLDLSKLWELVEDRGAKNGAVHEMAKSLTRLSN